MAVVVSRYEKNKEAIKARVAEWQKNNPEKVKCYKQKYELENKKKIQARQNESRKSNPIPYLLSIAKGRANKRGLEFSISSVDLSLPVFCPYLGIKLDNYSVNKDFHYSIDRIDNSKGYVSGNVEIISNRANRLKNNATAEELLKIAQRMLENVK